MSNDPKRFLRYLEAERKASLLYRQLAETVSGDRAEALIELADIEDAHAEHWLEKLVEYGVEIPPAPTLLDPADQKIVNMARATGLNSVLGTLEQNEGADAGMYDDEPEALDSMPLDEREHAEVFRSMSQGSPIPTITSRAVKSLKGTEPWHKVDTSGSVRAAVFGISDGLVSNTALVMGFAGASLNGSLDNSTVLFAGLAGLIAGAFSMAAGEYVSVASQRDLFMREIEKEAIELREKPEEEAKELELIYRAKGLDRAQAKAVSDKIMSDPKAALDTLVREELGLNPDELGSPVRVAISSFIAFTIGASVAVLPYVFLQGSAAFYTAIVAAVIALCIVGGVVGKFSGRGIVFSAMRQLLWGAGAAGVTYAVGSIIGVTTG
jgi:VIT1/CCC1 family predicted Fe2+/Mn2+ transporter